MRKIKECPFSECCSSSSYGRTTYIKDKDERDSGTLLYRSDAWKKIYKNRTCTERINNYVLNGYKLHSMKIKNLSKFTFFSILSGINIHLDAWVKIENKEENK